MSGCGECNIPLVDNLEAVIDSGDVIIDFTMPESTLNNIQLAASKKKSMIIGTTGLSQQQIDTIGKYASEVRWCWRRI